jgi:hypothetical protein
VYWVEPRSAGYLLVRKFCVLADEHVCQKMAGVLPEGGPSRWRDLRPVAMGHPER